MVTARRHLLVAGFLLISFSSNEVRSQCSKQDYQHCVKLADPLLKDPHLIYPDNPRDIENVCRTWTFFVECVKSYTDRCFTEARRREFNKAVESPVSSIHKLCSMPDYRDDYLKHATCMKMTLTQDSHCGRHYRLLVSQVSGEAPTASVCCSHHMLRECVVDQAKNTCDPESAPYSATMLDKALSFLRDQCSNFIPNQFDCPGSDFYKSTPPSRAETDRRLMDQEPIIVNTRPTYVEVQTTATRSTMGSSARMPPATMASSPSMSTSTTALDSRDIFSMGSLAIKLSATSASSPSMLPFTTLDSRDIFTMGFSSRMPPSTMASSSSMSASRIRDFGGSSARMPPSTMTSGLPSTSTTLVSRGSGSSLHPSIPSSTRSEPDPWSPTVTTAQEETERSSFARGMTWRTVGGAPPTSPGTWKVSSSDIWLPSSRPPAMIDNAIDEPNQQGLGSGQMDSSAVRRASAPLALAGLAALLACLATFHR